MNRLKAIVPYLVFLVFWFGLPYLYQELFGHPPGVPRLYEEHWIWWDLGKRNVFLLFTYPVAIYIAKLVAELRPGALFGTLAFFYVALWLYFMQMFDRMYVTQGEETFFSTDGILSYEHWPYAAVQFLSATLLPVLILVLMNHHTSRAKQTRESAPFN